MLFEITHLRAPWPAGASVGDFVDLPQPTPHWAVGKVRPAPANAQATVFMDGTPRVTPPKPRDAMADELVRIRAENARLTAENEQLRALATRKPRASKESATTNPAG